MMNNRVAAVIVRIVSCWRERFRLQLIYIEQRESMGFQNSRGAKTMSRSLKRSPLHGTSLHRCVVSGVVSRWLLVGSRPAEIPRQAFESWTSLPNNFSLLDVYMNLIVSKLSASPRLSPVVQSDCMQR
jgi:hypothetical protein